MLIQLGYCLMENYTTWN